MKGAMKNFPRSAESGIWASGRAWSWNVVVIQCLLLLFAELLVIFHPLKPTVSAITHLLQVAHVAITGTVLALVPLLKKRGSRNLAALCFVIITLPGLGVLWGNQAALAHLGTPISSLSGPKLLFIALAVLVPGPYWVNAALMLMVAMETAAMWFLLDLGAHQVTVIPKEPWQTLMYGVVAVVLLYFRRRDEQMIRSLSRGQAKTEMLEMLAKIFLSIRDLSNTPLQTIELSVEILKRRPAESQYVLPALTNATRRLSQMNKIFSHLESQLSWDREDLMSEHEILRLMADLKKQQHGGISRNPKKRKRQQLKKNAA